MIGLELPYVIQCKQTDRANLRTLVNLLQKTRKLKLIHMTHTWIILKIIGQHPDKIMEVTRDLKKIPTSMEFKRQKS